MLRFLAALALSAAPVQAQMLTGADDPAFQAVMTTLLAADDPAAVATLRDLAEAGNPAALVALPFALQWVPPQGNLKEKNAQRQVGGVNAQDAAAVAHPATALWDAGQVEDPMALPDRAAGLLALGEPEKSALLISNWLNQSGGLGVLPAQLMTPDTPAILGAFALSFRLTNAAYSGQDAATEAAFLLSMLREDQLAAWVAYVYLLDRDPGLFNSLGNPLAGTGLSAADTEARMADARAVLAVSRAMVFPEAPTPADTATRALDALRGRAELLPVTRLCQAHCPDSLATCQSAVLAYPGLPFGSFEAVQPFADVLDPAVFAASDRGVFALITPRQDPAAAADRATAEGLDACYGALLQRRDTLAFGP
jgi:hypothetical protein